MGLIVNVYRAPRWEREGFDPSNGGLTSRFEELLVVNVPGPIPNTSELYAKVLLVDDQPCGQPYPKLVPADPDDIWKPYRSPINVGPMMGGNYASTSDSRFAQAVEELCGMRLGILPVHDRFESQKAYNLLSAD